MLTSPWFWGIVAVQFILTVLYKRSKAQDELRGEKQNAAGFYAWTSAELIFLTLFSFGWEGAALNAAINFLLLPALAKPVLRLMKLQTLSAHA